MLSLAISVQNDNDMVESMRVAKLKKEKPTYASCIET